MENIEYSKEDIELLEHQKDDKYNIEYIPYYFHIAKDFQLTPAETIVYGFIRFYLGFNKSNKGFFFSSKKLGDSLNMNDRTINNIIVKLKEKGLITTITERKGFSQRRFIFLNKEFLNGKPDNKSEGQPLPSHQTVRTISPDSENDITNQGQPISLNDDNDITNQGQQLLNISNKYNYNSSSGNFENENTNSTTTEPTESRTTTTADKKIKDYSEKNKKQLEDILLKIENKQSLRYVFYSHCIKRCKILVGKLNLDLLEEKIFELSRQVGDNKSFLNELIKMIDYYYESGKNIKLFSSVMVRWFDKYISNVEKE